MAEHFIPNDDETKTVVHHKNGITTDFSLKNLQWTTESQNAKYAVPTKKPKRPQENAINLPNEEWRDIQNFSKYSV